MSDVIGVPDSSNDDPHCAHEKLTEEQHNLKEKSNFKTLDAQKHSGGICVPRYLTGNSWLAGQSIVITRTVAGSSFDELGTRITSLNSLACSDVKIQMRRVQRALVE
ncbi:hypothetical protein T265_00919 [Opisthorchis viverrini]|uniref:Uncharacterized protein n=1 Tax=Opisthorchis viverrini TaxID=6198 RepID=A0A075A4P1_OPIVI|nr:hypothetical protein T265_00919 [Opisthorchis viverrini]KER33232.1 hypothetical protein T265_00919 [Opisthorchis viverrini]